jgi:hypothetical protein
MPVVAEFENYLIMLGGNSQKQHTLFGINSQYQH